MTKIKTQKKKRIKKYKIQIIRINIESKARNIKRKEEENGR